uniref:Uncharacterized protein n=1 Tax=Attheya septentrionalis TaxID=420275 RepID=A0A7S2UBI2_9STRA|mmetsp:Transcript_15937/g.28988  ORF Transcript_15937/g.28988 Transcript_15937/m.28988 type:complete len:192 (+) Transcript_15937:336-911(+)
MLGGLVSYMQSWVTTLMMALGLLNKKGTILLLGLDNAGKTTLLHRLRTNSLLSFPPTERPNLERFTVHGITFVGWDLGGHEAVRHLWDEYVCDGSNAVVFVIDVADAQRLGEVRDELDALVNDGAIEGVPLAILLNKCDLEQALSSNDISQGIGYEELVMRHGEDLVGMFRISVLRGEGYDEAFRWIATFL